MFNFLFRSLWRVLIFAAGTLILWFTVFRAFPYADARLPLYVVLLLLYCFLAYVAIPALIRVFRLVIKPNRIPLYVTMSDCWPSDPVNLAVIVKDRQHLLFLACRVAEEVDLVFDGLVDHIITGNPFLSRCLLPVFRSGQTAARSRLHFSP